MSVNVRIQARLLDGPGTETFWATPQAEDHHYQVANMLVFAPIGLGDIVKCRPGPSDQPPQVIEVVTRGRRTTIGVLLEPASSLPSSVLSARAAITDVTRNLARQARARGANTETHTEGICVIQLPEHTDPDRFLTSLDIAINPDEYTLTWEHLSGPDDPIGPATNSILDITARPAPPTLKYEPYEPSLDVDLEHAIVNAREREDLPGWLPTEILHDLIRTQYQTDPRVRHALKTGNYGDVITLGVRIIANINGIVVPPLDKPLLADEPPEA